MSKRKRTHDGMQRYTTNDNVDLAYQDVGDERCPPLILLHGFTGSSAVWQRNIPALSETFRVIAPDLRGHGKSGKPDGGHHVSRLAMDLKNLIDHLDLPYGKIKCIAGSLGCAILWSFGELFTAAAFSHMVWVDQAPLQNYTSDGSWGPTHGNRSCNSAAALAHIQATLQYSPEDVYRGTIASCLAYRSHPRLTDKVTAAQFAADERLFLDIARQGNAVWFGKLMADHTSLDWRASIRHCFGYESLTAVLVIASDRSGCFPSEGPLAVVNLAGNPKVAGLSVDWGGHWCYWEDPEKFNDLVLMFLV